jgi:hypothetical protein
LYEFREARTVTMANDKTNTHRPMGDELERFFIEHGITAIHCAEEPECNVIEELKAHIATHYVPRAQVNKDIVRARAESYEDIRSNIMYHFAYAKRKTIKFDDIDKIVPRAIDPINDKVYPDFAKDYDVTHKEGLL